MIKVIQEVSKQDLMEHLYNINLEDKSLYEEINTDNYIGVFQFNGNTATELVKLVHPDNFEEMVAVNSLARPGTSSFAEMYIYNKKHPGSSSYPKQISDLLKTSYNVILYQENVMAIFNKVGGFSLEGTNCLSGEMCVKTSDGIKTIKEIVENKISSDVLTFNEQTKNFEWKKIKDWFNNGSKEILSIELENGKILKCTKEHKIYTENRGWVEAQYLKLEDELIFLEEEEKLECPLF